MNSGYIVLIFTILPENHTYTFKGTLHATLYRVTRDHHRRIPGSAFKHERPATRLSLQITFQTGKGSIHHKIQTYTA
jgi:hypothetical protein